MLVDCKRPCHQHMECYQRVHAPRASTQRWLQVLGGDETGDTVFECFVGGDMLIPDFILQARNARTRTRTHTRTR